MLLGFNIRDPSSCVVSFFASSRHVAPVAWLTRYVQYLLALLFREIETRLSMSNVVSVGRLLLAGVRQRQRQRQRPYDNCFNGL